MLPGLGAAALMGGKSAVTPTIDYLQQTAGDSAASQTLTGVNIGAAHAKRIVAVAIYLRNSGGARTVSSCTIGGVAATVVNSPGPDLSMAIAYAAVPTGTTADIAITASGTLLAKRIATYRIIANSPTPSDSLTTVSTSPSLSLSNSAVGMFAVNNAAAANGNSLSSSSNITIDMSRTDTSSNRVSEAGRVNSIGSAFSMASSGGQSLSLIGVGWA